MSNLIALKEYIKFDGAAKEARSLASKHGQTIIVTRSPLGWAIMVTQELHEEISLNSHAENEDEDEETDFWIDDSNETSANEYNRELVQELLDDQDCYARADQDGWFYDE